MKLAAIVLAAGLSKRMGAFKPLLPLADKPMIAHVLDALKAVDEIDSIYVVTGHDERRLREALQAWPIAFVHNAAYATGEMLSSVQSGLRALPDDVDAAVLALGDQPSVQAPTVRQLVRAWMEKRAPLALPKYRGKRGHPLLLSMSLRAEILALGDGESLKTVVHRHLDQAVQIDVEDPAVIADLDTPDDYARAQLKFSRG